MVTSDSVIRMTERRSDVAELHILPASQSAVLVLRDGRAELWRATGRGARREYRHASTWSVEQTRRWLYQHTSDRPAA